MMNNHLYSHLPSFTSMYSFTPAYLKEGLPEEPVEVAVSEDIVYEEVLNTIPTGST